MRKTTCEKGRCMSGPTNQREPDEDVAIQRLLSAAGASWSRDINERLPPAKAFAQRMRQQLMNANADHREPHPATSTLHVSALAPTPNVAPLASAASPTQSQKGSRPMSTLTRIPQPVAPTAPRRSFAWGAALAATLVVVALIAVILAHGLASERPGIGANSSGLPYDQVTPTPVYITSMAYSPVIAPSDPQVVYTQIANGMIFERSSDGGATYRRITTPTTTLQNPRYALLVSPLDANHLIATVTGASTGGLIGCDTAVGMAPGQTSICSQGYLSADGGQSWRGFTLPSAGMVGAISDQQIITSPLYAPATTLFAQGSRLYAIAGVALQNGYIIGSPQTRLVVSNNDGASWQAADTGFAGRVCDFAAAPTGSTVYALVAPNSFCNVNATHSLDLLRSDDAGAIWTHVNTLPAVDELGMRVAANGALYINQPKTFSDFSVQANIDSSPDTLIASQDGGVTFTRSSLAGAPATANLAGPVGVLSDGSALMESIYYQKPHSLGQATLYAWRVGAASWRQVSPQYADQLVDVVVTVHHGTDTVYVIETNGQISHFTV